MKEYSRKINGQIFQIEESESVKSNGVGYYKVKNVDVVDSDGKATRFVVSVANYWNEYSSIRAGVLDKFFKQQ